MYTDVMADDCVWEGWAVRLLCNGVGDERGCGAAKRAEGVYAEDEESLWVECCSSAVSGPHLHAASHII